MVYKYNCFKVKYENKVKDMNQNSKTEFIFRKFYL